MLVLNQVCKTFTSEVPAGKSNKGKSLGKVSQIQAADQLSFLVQDGEIFGFLGPNGAGKTTTIRIILNIIRPDKGAISWQG